MARPNILMVITHDSGRHFGCYGAGVETPNVDRIAAEGVRFDQAFCTAPQCSPARGSLLTGKYPHRNGLIGLTHRGFRLRPEVKRLPAMLSDAGYHTILFGLHHEEPDAHQMGYRRVVTAADRNIKNVMPEVESFLSSQPAEPFFAVVGFFETHRPYDTARHPMDDPATVKTPSWLPDEKPVRLDTAELNGNIRGVDEAVGRIDAALRSAGLADNTLLVYTTDHGIAFPFAKATLFDAGVGVALVARGPKGSAWTGGKTVDAMVSTMDLTPTLLNVAGAEVPDDLDGMDLSPLVANPAADWRDYIFFEQTFHAAYDPMRAVRTKRYKYIRHFADRPVMFAPNVDEGHAKDMFMQRGLHQTPRDREMLLDLSQPGCENRIDDPALATVREELSRRLDEWMRQTGDRMIEGDWPQPEGTTVTPAGSLRASILEAPADWRQ